MLIKPAPILVEDILATGSTASPVTVECAGRGTAGPPLGHGWLQDEEVQPGFRVFAADYAAYEDYAVLSAAPPGFLIAVNLGCPQAGELGGKTWELASDAVYALNLREPVKRRALRGAHTQQTRCGVLIADEWFESGRHSEIEASSTQIRELLQSHMIPWKAKTPTLLGSVAQRLTTAMETVGPLGRLRREAVGLELLFETLSLFNAESDAGRTSAPRREMDRIHDVRHVLDSLGPLEEIVLTDLARQAGMSVRSLNRHFRSTFGTTICAYVASSRMESARQALEHGEATIDIAAYIAGFSSQANFSKAFRRHYGRTPGSLALRTLRRPVPRGK